MPDKVAEAFRGTHAELLHTNLSGDQEAELREMFADADTSADTDGGPDTGTAAETDAGAGVAATR